MHGVDGTNRRTLKMIDRYPTPQQLTQRILANKWYYKTNQRFYESRDKALCSVLYVGCLRNLEVQGLSKNQFTIEEDQIKLESVKLAKATRRSKKTGKTIMRKQQYRPEVLFPLSGERQEFGEFIADYLLQLGQDDRLFPIKNSRVDQIVKAIVGVPPHWLRAFGENYLYDNWDKDIMAVSSYVSVDARTLALYLQRKYLEYTEKGAI